MAAVGAVAVIAIAAVVVAKKKKKPAFAEGEVPVAEQYGKFPENH